MSAETAETPTVNDALMVGLTTSAAIVEVATVMGQAHAHAEGILPEGHPILVAYEGTLDAMTNLLDTTKREVDAVVEAGS